MRTRIEAEIKYSALSSEKTSVLVDWRSMFGVYAEYIQFLNVGLVVLLGACVCMCLRARCMKNDEAVQHVNSTRDYVFFLFSNVSHGACVYYSFAVIGSPH